MLVLAHRGCPTASRPENTLAAVMAALDAGVDGVEVDVRLTADGVLVCSHDVDLVRLAGVGLAVADATVPELGRVPLEGGHATATRRSPSAPPPPWPPCSAGPPTVRM